MFREEEEKKKGCESNDEPIFNISQIENKKETLVKPHHHYITTNLQTAKIFNRPIKTNEDKKIKTKPIISHI